MTDSLLFRRAARSDLSFIVHMLADDELGKQREKIEDPLPETYLEAFDAISRDDNHELIVAELDGKVIGTLHLMFLPSISYQGGLRSQVESVRVNSNNRGRGIGTLMMEYALQRTKERGAHLMQLMSHETRTDAHRFYERLGFKKAHVGMKLSLK